MMDLPPPPPAIVLTWNDNSTNEEGHLIERRLDDGEFSVIGNLPSEKPEETGAISFRTVPIDGHINVYRIRAYRMGQYSKFTKEAAYDAAGPNANPDGITIKTEERTSTTSSL